MRIRLGNSAGAASAQTERSIMPYPPQVFIRPMRAPNATGNASVTFDLGRRRPFLCWVNVTMIGSPAAFDRDNAIAADIFTIDGVQQPTRVFGGDHFGPNGLGDNVMPGGSTPHAGRVLPMRERSQ
jgi:hypothetical protein